MLKFPHGKIIIGYPSLLPLVSSPLFSYDTANSMTTLLLLLLLCWPPPCPLSGLRHIIM